VISGRAKEVVTSIPVGFEYAVDEALGPANVAPIELDERDVSAN
jgi:hypothetical protein